MSTRIAKSENVGKLWNFHSYVELSTYRESLLPFFFRHFDFMEEIVDSTGLPALSVVFQKLTDPRDPRGVRFPFSALCSLVFLGLLARICEMAVLVRWAEAHWDQLREPLGFKRPEKPSATCISRSLAQLSLAEFRQAFAAWIMPLRDSDSPPFFRRR